MERILLVEDDRGIVRSLREFLTSEGFAVEAVDGQRAATERLAAERFDLLLVDISLADGNGFAVCKAAKERGLPVIFLTASGDEYSTVTGLDMGADDYVAKPFGILEIIARINANIRKKAKKSDVLSYKEIRINDSKHEVYVADAPVELTVKEYDLLKLLVQNHENVVRRNDILDAVWGKDYGETRTLDIHVAELRKAISHADAKIVTVRGVGYSLK